MPDIVAHQVNCLGDCSFDRSNPYLETCDECKRSVPRCVFFLNAQGDSAGYCESCQTEKEKASA